jgi:acetyl esterase/lipase
MVQKSGRDMLYDLPPAQKQEKPWIVPPGFVWRRIDAGGVAMEILSGRDVETGPGNVVILHFHGGGYVEAITNPRRNIALRYCRAGKGVPVFSPDYRIAPEYTYPAALEDGLAAWDWMMAQGYKGKNIIVTADSAGGNLALALVLKLRDANRSLPRALFLMSPWTDAAAEGASYGFNLFRDPLFGKSKNYLPLQTIEKRYLAYVGGASPHDPYLSPAYGNFQGFPPLFLQTGNWEMLLSDTITVYEKARDQGVRVTLSLYDGMFHAFQFGKDLYPECRRAWKEVAEFLRTYLA